MISIDGNHPDVRDFATIKADKSKVTGANISIKIHDEFMYAVENDLDYILNFPVDSKLEPFEISSGEGINDFSEYIKSIDYNVLYKHPNNGTYFKKIKAREYWDLYMLQSKNSAEPGIMFWDNVLNYDPAAVYDEYMPITSNPCFTGDMELLTENGYVNFSNLVDSDIKLKNELGEIVNGKVWSNGIKDINAVKLSSGKIIKSTPDHIFKLIDGTEEISKNLKGKRLMPYIKIPVYNNLMTKLGFIQGDASITDVNKKNNQGFTIHIGKKDDDILRLFNFEKKGRHYYTTDYVKYLYEYGFNITTLPNRNLPSEYKNLNKKEKLSFLQGLYSANGSIISKTRISFKTTCHKLAEELVEALKEFEIYAYITTNKAKVTEFDNGEYLCKESYDVNIQKYESMLLFANNIGFVHEYKNYYLRQLLMLKSPKVTSIKNSGKEEVFDFNLNSDNHWGVVEGRVVHNCGEQFLNANDSCRLLALNLYSFVEHPFTEEAYFNFDRFYRYTYESTRLGDNLIDLEVKYINRIIDKIQSDPEPFYIKDRDLELWAKSKETAMKGRRIGLGITALGDTLAALGLSYDSREALLTVDSIMRNKFEAELDCSIDLAILRGHFTGYDSNKEFIITDEGVLYGTNKFYEFIVKTFPARVRKMLKYGRRNVSWSTVAPTGSVSILTQTTSGIEPVFKALYTRRKKVNPGSKDVKIDFIDIKGDAWEEFPVIHPKFKDFINIKFKVPYEEIDTLPLNKIEEYFKHSPWYEAEANDIDWKARIKMQGIIQKYTTNAISSTINLPNTTTPEEVSEMFMLAHKEGLKGLTIYVEGSRDGVLVSSNNKDSEDFPTVHAPKRPKELQASLHMVKVKGVDYAVVVGLYKNKPYEIFAFNLLHMNIKYDPSKPIKGVVVKIKKGHYQFISNSLTIDNLNETYNSVLERLCTINSSMLLRHGAPINFISKTVKKIDPSINSFVAAINRVLSKYTEIEVSECPECGGKLVHEAGCETCTDCGYSKCS